MKKKLYGIVFVLLSLLLLTACSGVQTETPPEVDPNVLTEEELAEFQGLFSSGSWYSQGTWKYFDSPEYVSLRHLFYEGISYRGLYYSDCYLTQAEKDWYQDWYESQYSDHEIYGSIARAPREAMNDILQKYYGITLEESQKVGLDTFVYWEETDAYYHNHSDTALTSVTLLSGYHTEDGCVHLIYQPDSYSKELAQITLRWADEDELFGGCYRFIANQPYEPAE